MSRYAVRVIGPSGMTTYVAIGGVEVGNAENAYHYRDADTAWQAGESYRLKWGKQNFTYDVMNVDDPEASCSP